VAIKVTEGHWQWRYLVFIDHSELLY